jgi:hypothetical protein
MRSDSIHGDLADSEWAAFITKPEAAEHEFAQVFWGILIVIVGVVVAIVEAA